MLCALVHSSNQIQTEAKTSEENWNLWEQLTMKELEKTVEYQDVSLETKANCISSCYVRKCQSWTVKKADEKRWIWNMVLRESFADTLS